MSSVSLSHLDFVWVFLGSNSNYRNTTGIKFYTKRSTFLTEVISKGSPATCKVFGPEGAREFTLTFDNSAVKATKEMLMNAEWALNNFKWRNRDATAKNSTDYAALDEAEKLARKNYNAARKKVRDELLHETLSVEAETF